MIEEERDPFLDIPGPDAEIRARLEREKESVGDERNVFRSARVLIEQGFDVLPLLAEDTKPVVLNGRPIALRVPEQVDAIFQEHMNIGIWLGDIRWQKTKLCVIHADPVRGRATLTELRKLGMTISTSTPRYKTPDDGVDLLFAIPQREYLVNRDEFMPGISFKCSGYVVTPCSQVRDETSGELKQYRWLTPIPVLADIPMMPMWLINYVRKGCRPLRPAEQKQLRLGL